MRRLVVVSDRPLDGLLLLEELLELGIGLADERLGLLALGHRSAVGRRRAAAEETTLRGRAWPDVSPTAMAASFEILSSRALL